MALPDRTTPRPTFSETFAEFVEQEVLHWISNLKATMEKDAYQHFISGLPQPDQERSFRDLLHSLAEGARRDGYAYCEALKNTLQWPVDAELCAIFVRVIKDTETKHLRRRTTEWVMKTGMRFHGNKGDIVTVKPPGYAYERKATILTVDKPIAAGRIRFVSDEKEIDVLAEYLVA